jgi:hypothetical protein
MKLGVYVVAPDPISTAYLEDPPHQSVCLVCVFLLSAKHVPVATNTQNNRRTTERARAPVCVWGGLSVYPPIVAR